MTVTDALGTVVGRGPDGWTMPDGGATVSALFEQPNFVLPAGITAIEESAFEGDLGISVVIIPAGCTSIGDRAFKDCLNLKWIRIPEGCELGEDVFDGCILVRVHGTPNSSAWDYCQEHTDNCVYVID